MTQAAKFFDPVLGIDIHMVVIPPSPAPVPMPHPFIGIVFDPIGAAIGAAIGLVLGGGGPVLINSMPVGNTGTEVLGIPHFPMGASFHACDPKPSHDGVIITGSKTVTMAGASTGRLGSMVMTCNFPINLPTSLCLAVPMGPPVIVGGPDSFDILAAVTQGIRTKWVSDKLHKLLKAKPGSRLSKFICFLTGHPVDVMTGAVLTDATDFELPGPVPLKFERNYYSRDPQAGSLGQGWSHSLEAALRDDEDGVLVQLEDGRQVAHLPLRVGQSVFEPSERYTLSRADEHEYSLTHADGRTLDFSRVAGAAWTCPLACIRDRNGNAITLAYEAGRLASATDSAGRKLRFVHDDAGRLTSVRLHRGGTHGKWIELVRYAYDERGQLAAANDPKGRPFTYAYRGGVLVRETNRNGLSFYFEYDWDHPDGWCVRTWGDGGIYGRQITYDKHRHVTIVDDSRGGRTHYFGNDAGLVDRVLDPEGGEWRYEWHPQLLRKTAEIDPLGHRQTWEYDPRGNVLCATDALSQRTRWRYDELDLPVEMIDASGYTWQRQYDRRGNLIKSVDPLGATYRYRYDHRGHLIEATDPLGYKIQFTVNEAGQVVAANDRVGATTRYTHDDRGRLVRHVGPLGGETVLHWDECSRLVAVERPDRSRVSLDYDAEGNLVRRVDGLGHLWRYTYSGLNKLHRQTDPLGHHVGYHYDTEENLVTLTNEHDEPYTFTYDRRGLVTREVGFDGRTHIYEYDRAGRSVVVTNGRKQRTKITRDALGRLVDQIGSDGVWLRFAYDATGNLVEATNEHCVVRFERDACGRVLREAANDHVVESTYDLGGNRTCRRTSLGHEVHYDHDGNGKLIHLRISKVDSERMPPYSSDLGERSFWGIEVCRDAEGNEISRHFPGGIESRWTRDAMGRPLSHSVLRHPYGLTPTKPQQTALPLPSEELLQTTYEWLPEDRLVAKHEHGRGSSRYSYNARGALIETSHSDGAIRHRAMDAVLNVYGSVERTDRAYGAGGRIVSANEAQYLHDADGNLAFRSDAHCAMTWNSLGQLVRVAGDEGVTDLVYDALGRRIQQRDVFSIRQWVWDGLNPVHGSGCSGLTWVFDPGSFKPVAQISEKDAELAPVITDHKGEPIAELKDVCASRSSLPFAALGQFTDAPAGLYYNYFRYYDPHLGRYISQDPLRLRGGLRPYSYPQNPQTTCDPLGLSAQLCGDVNGKQHYKGTEKPWTEGAAPNSIYTHVDPNTGKALQNAVYDADGKVIGHVDFKNHGGAVSGHGHKFPTPGNPATGHGAGKPHYAPSQLPADWGVLPGGVSPHTPLGT